MAQEETKIIQNRIAEISQEFSTQIDKISSVEKLQQLKNQYLGKKGAVKNFYQQIKNLPNKDRPVIGALVNQTAQKIENDLAAKRKQLEQGNLINNEKEIDLTAPFDINCENKPALLNQVGTEHIIYKGLRHMVDVLQRMGFSLYEARELDDDYHNFDSVNIPKGHPARDMWDTFFTEERLIPIVHTSNMQNRIMKLEKPPIRAIIFGKCARNENVDASHGHTFHQIEGVYVDKKIAVKHMITTIKTYLEGFYERKVKVKIQPSYFPFVEPGIEYLIDCIICNGKGCSTCKHSGWLEIMGAGMIHRNVLKEAGLNPDIYTGFAWGFGLDRIVMMKYGVNRIHHLFNSDLRFLKQFN